MSDTRMIRFHWKDGTSNDAPGTGDTAYRRAIEAIKVVAHPGFSPLVELKRFEELK